MSLLAANTSEDDPVCSTQTPRVRVILRTADQYPLWKARVIDACWAATRMNLFDVSDNECIANMRETSEAKDAPLKEQAKLKHLLTGLPSVLVIATTSLHDDHVTRSYCFSAVRNSLRIGLPLYSATMAKEGQSDL